MGDKSSNLATLAQNIKQGVANALKDLHTIMPGIIESFDPVTQTASVQPAIKRIFKTDDGQEIKLVPEPLPVCINVPVHFPRGGGFSLTFPVKKGDECELRFSERSIDLWHQAGGVQQPGARRFHHLSDAICTVGISSIPKKITNFDPDNVVLRSDNENTSLTLKANGNAVFKATTKLIVEAPLAEFTEDLTVKGKLKVEGATELTTDVTSAGKDIGDKHAHDGSPTAAQGPTSDTGTVK